MNALATASSKAVFGDLMTAHQTVASNTPAKLAATKFADYLEEKQSANRLPSVSPGQHPSPELLGKVLFGNAWDADTKTIRLDKIAADIQKLTAEFAGQFRQALANRGIDPNIPAELSVGGDGRIIVDNGHPQAAEISKLFAADPQLAQAYRDVATQNDHLTLMQAGAAYVKDWNAAKTDGERTALWNRYSTLMDKMISMFSGRMTFAPNTVVAESQQMLRRMDLS
ncbi:hypothetical protein [Ferrovibrio sp.]|uniref:hypothetical protein n=1 Tax=Ferrovibrio sp. TaxID=1917215 RepID=UPI000CCA2840|nr:hypothetical protein [Ferrovibrio sp.]PJI37693.1 MAG: hypothetical protein CTR53_18840 [Ferrovibrio sp.]